MKQVNLILILVVLILTSCTQEVPKIEELSSGQVCLPYSPMGQVVYEAEWTGQYPEIEAYDKPYQTVTFGMGCFWGPAAEFAVIHGVLRTRVGYAGGDSTTPSYDNLGNHVEVFEVDYDPEILSYEDLVTLYFSIYDATARPFSQRVTSVIYYRNTEEQALAEKVKSSVEAQSEKGIFTILRPIDTFYLAEAKHQLSYLKQEVSLYGEVEAMFGDQDRLLLSILASKLNGFIAGYGSTQEIDDVLEQSSLSAASLERLDFIIGHHQ